MPTDATDRLSVPRGTVLEHARIVIPQLGLGASQEPAPLIQEIIERSGLLLEVDGGERIQFSHLTIQEYFAAEALLNEQAGLLSRFTARPDVWRETAKLWCGRAPDSTGLIDGISKIELHTAFECLADSIQVDPAVANWIIDQMQERLPDAATDLDVARAFAALASGRGERSLRTFDFLAATIADNHSNSDRSKGAIQALCLTNLPSATVRLGRAYGRFGGDVSSALVRMGDISLPELIALARAGNGRAYDDIAAIATPAAAVALADLMDGSATGTDRRRAAWHLAALLAQPGVEEALAQRPFGIRHEKYAWMWQPFGDPRSVLGSTVSRIADNILQSETYEAPKTIPFDPRIAMPLAAEALGRTEVLFDELEARIYLRLSEDPEPKGKALESLRLTKSSDPPSAIHPLTLLGRAIVNVSEFHG